jgi:hypothetical protein
MKLGMSSSYFAELFHDALRREQNSSARHITGILTVLSLKLKGEHDAAEIISARCGYILLISI